MAGSASADSQPRDEGDPAKIPAVGIRHRSQAEIGPFTLTLRLSHLPAQSLSALPCTAAMDEELAEHLASIEHNEAALRESRDASGEIDSAIEEGFRTGVIEVGRHRIFVGPVKPEHVKFLKERFRESLGQALRQDAERLTRLIDDQREVHERRMKVRNAAIPLCRATDQLEQIGFGVQRYEQTEAAAGDAAASFGGGRWSLEREYFFSSGTVEHSRLEASSVGWERPSGTVDWDLTEYQDRTGYRTVTVEALRVDAAQRERLAAIFASFGSAIEQARDHDRTWGHQELNLEYRLKHAAHSAMRTLWDFALTPEPENLHELVESPGPELPMPELEGEILILMGSLSPFADSFPIAVMGEASVEVPHRRPPQKVFSIDHRLGEGPGNSGLSGLEGFLAIPPFKKPSSDAFQRRPDRGEPVPGSDPFISNRIEDWPRAAIVAHGHGAVQGSLREIWQDNSSDGEAKFEKRWGWSISFGETAAVQNAPAELRPEEKIELRVMTTEGTGFRTIEGPLPFGRPFFVEALLEEGSDRESLEVALGAGTEEDRRVILFRSPEDARRLRSEMLYLMWQAEDGANVVE